MNQESTAYWQNLDTVTRSTIDQREITELRIPGLTILAHADAGRVGERAALIPLASGEEVALSRLEPVFAAPGEARRRALADPHLSRRPVRLTPAPDGAVRLLLAGSKIRVEVDGAPVTDSCLFSAAELERGVVLLLADKVALLLHTLSPALPQVRHFGLVGESAGLVAVRQQIARVADLDVPALLRGETGTGKELVASAIHQASKRSAGPFVAVNMGAIPPTLAAAELFGVVKGAFTGADRRRSGYFARAQGGTLFLDEVGETPVEIQALLLRALETGVIQPVGSEKPVQVDVRILAATDARLEAEIEAGRFRAPLLHRLSGYEIRLPPLRDRRDDIGRLLVHFLTQELEVLGEGRHLDAGAKRSWLPAAVAARLALQTWSGNVRQLRNVARQLVIDNRGAPRLKITPLIEALLDEEPARLEPQAGVRAADEEPGGPRSVLKTVVLVRSVGHERLEETLREPFLERLLQRFGEVLTRSLDTNGGSEVDAATNPGEASSPGRAFLFERPVDAASFALEVHRGLKGLAEETSIDLRAGIGIHLAEVLLTAGGTAAGAAETVEIEGVAGAMVDRLARLARGGQTLLTQSACDLAKQAVRADARAVGRPLGNAGVRWLAHGEYHVEGIEDPVDVFEVGEEGYAPLIAPMARGDGSGTWPASGDEPQEAIARVAEAEEPPAPQRPSYRSPHDVSEDEILEALRAHGFRLQPTAAALGISRTSLYALVDKSSRIRKARDLTREEIERCREEHGGDPDAMAAALEVSRKGLTRRMTQLGLKSS